MQRSFYTPCRICPYEEGTLEHSWNRHQLTFHANIRIECTSRSVSYLSRDFHSMAWSGGRYASQVRLHCEWQDDDFDVLSSTISNSTNHVERIVLCQKADEILAREVPRIPILYWRMHVLVKPWTMGYSMYRLVTWIWKDVIIETH
jgi:hypothetical protein